MAISDFDDPHGSVTPPEVRKASAIREQWAPSRECCDLLWEEAYARFETPAQETRKFLRRLQGFGAGQWQKDLSVVELFCGRGGGLDAWQKLGFSGLEGVDISAALLMRYSGSAKLYLGDCRCLRLPDESRDVICVQGGLHHLPMLPEDLQRTVNEVRRVLRPGGRFIVVEPWTTPFLNLVHGICRVSVVRRTSNKLDALACMIDRERDTYFNWLSRAEEILGTLAQGFRVERKQVAWGKLSWLGRKT